MMFNLANSKRIESKGSWWFFDDEAKLYIRAPKSESPREHPTWGGAAAGVLQDFVEHPYEWFATATCRPTTTTQRWRSQGSSLGDEPLEAARHCCRVSHQSVAHRTRLALRQAHHDEGVGR